MAKTYPEVIPAAPTAEQQARQTSPLSIIVFAVVGGSIALGLVLFAVRLARLDGNWREATQYGIGGFLVPWVLLGGFALLLLFREFIFVIEMTARRDLTGDGQIGRPVMALNPYQGREALAADNRNRALSQWEMFVQGCEVNTSWLYWRDRINRETWQDWRDQLMSSGWAEWNVPNNKNMGWKLSAPAQEILAALRM